MLLLPLCLSMHDIFLLWEAISSLDQTGACVKLNYFEVLETFWHLCGLCCIQSALDIIGFDSLTTIHMADFKFFNMTQSDTRSVKYRLHIWHSMHTRHVQWGECQFGQHSLGFQFWRVMIMISPMSVHEQCEPRIYVNTHHQASAEGHEMTWNDLQGWALLRVVHLRNWCQDEWRCKIKQVCDTVGNVFRFLWLAHQAKLQQVFCGCLPVEFRGELLPQHYQDGWPLREGIGRALQLRKLGTKPRPAKIYVYILQSSWDSLSHFKTSWES